MLQARDTRNGAPGVRLRLALALAAVACAAPATAAATSHLRSAGRAKPEIQAPRDVVAGGRATGSVAPGGEPGGGWLGAIAP